MDSAITRLNAFRNLRLALAASFLVVIASMLLLSSSSIQTANLNERTNSRALLVITT